MAKTKKEIVTILCDGAWYADVPSGAYADEILKHLNDQSFEASAYRAQFATDDEWVRHRDENVA